MSTKILINSYFSDFEDNSDSDLIRKFDKKDFVQTAITLYDHEDMKNDTLWKQFRKNFADWIEDNVRALPARYAAYDIVQLTILRWIEID
jgi:hypothetical protein